DVSRHKKIKSELSKIAPTIMLVSGTGDYNANIEAFKTVAKAVVKDKASGRKTLPILLGKNASLTFMAIMYFIAYAFIVLTIIIK
ncbi:hypothetical protein QT22_00095, partial [Staphylococcus aureus]